jgi:hypothetical protein
MIKRFKQFVLENINKDEEDELRAMGFNASTVDIDQLSNAMGAQAKDNKLILTTEWNMSLDDFGIDSDNYPERLSDFYLEITVTVDFDEKKISASGTVRQDEIELEEAVELGDLDWGSVFPMGDPNELTTAEVGEALEEMMNSVAGFDDPTGLIDEAREIVENALLYLYGEEDDMLEDLNQDDEAELRSMGFSTIDVEGIGRGISELSRVEKVVVEGQTLTVEMETTITVDDNYFSDIDFGDLDIERDFHGEIQLILDFGNSTAKGRGYLSQRDLDLYEEFDLPLEWDDIFQNGDPVDLSVEETVDDLSHFIELAYHMEDTTGFSAEAERIVTQRVEELTRGGEDNEDELYEKKRLKWHDSDAPDAKGKFKELGVQKLADWLIRTRGGNMQKITGSLNQQINFNKRKNPSYAKKMESTREAVKRKLAKRKDK